MKSELKLFTSFVSKENLSYLSEKRLLPTFIIRNISNSKLIGKWSGTPLHIKEFSPSTELFQRLRSGEIDFSRYQKEYVINLAYVNFVSVIKRLEKLAKDSNASGIALLGFEKDPELCHRSLLSDILNRTHLLTNNVNEVDL